MSDHNQQDLPGISPVRPGSTEPKNLAAAFANLPPLDLGEPSTVSSEPMPEHQNKEVLSLPEPRVNAAKPKSHSPRKRSTSTRTEKALDAKRAKVVSAQGLPATEAKRAKSRKGNTKNLAASEQAGPQSGQVLAADSDMPPITDEAIAFLGTPDAKVSDLFKLQPGSRAFVQYHITNMQRLDAASKLANAALMAKATKFGARFEKVSDAMLQTLVKGRRPLAKQEATVVDQAGEASVISYGPQLRLSSVQVHVPIQMRKMEIAPAKGTLAEVSSAAKSNEHVVQSPKPLDVAGHLEKLGNTIERGTVPERHPESNKETRVSAPTGPTMAPGRSPSVRHLGLRARLLQALGSKLQIAASWLSDSSYEGLSGPPVEPWPVGQAPAVTTRVRSAETDPATVPEAVSRRFLNINRDYYFPDKTHAFRDSGNKLSTRGEHPEVVRSLVEIAKARGWDSITVKGTDQFRRSAWLEASKSGLTVAGYKPSALDLAELAQQPVRNMVEKDDAQIGTMMPTSAPKRQPNSPGSEPTATAQPIVDQASGHDVPKADRMATAKAFESDKPAFVVKKHPELAPAYGVVDAAKKFAEAYLPEEMQEEFIGLARRHVMQKLIAGEHVKGPRIHALHVREKTHPERSK